MGQLTELARAWFEKVWNQRDDDAIFELSVENAVGYAESDVRYFSMHAFKEFRDNVLLAMPDLRIDVEAIIEQDSHAVVRWFLTGTHTGPGFGFSPTHSRVSIRGMTWLRFGEDNKIVEGWDCWNQGRMMQTLIGGICPVDDEDDEEDEEDEEEDAPPAP